MLCLLFVVAVVVASEKTAAYAEIVAVAFRRALAKSNLSLKEAAWHMGVDGAQLSRELQGIGHLSLTRIGRMPREFTQWFALELVAALGMPADIRHAQLVQEALR
jgi:hypothetical protein